jgi:hypothetical protein
MIKGGLATSVLGKMYTSAFLSEFRPSYLFFFFFFFGQHGIVVILLEILLLFKYLGTLKYSEVVTFY